MSLEPFLNDVEELASTAVVWGETFCQRACKAGAVGTEWYLSCIEEFCADDEATAIFKRFGSSNDRCMVTFSTSESYETLFKMVRVRLRMRG